MIFEVQHGQQLGLTAADTVRLVLSVARSVRCGYWGAWKRPALTRLNQAGQRPESTVTALIAAVAAGKPKQINYEIDVPQQASDCGSGPAHGGKGKGNQGGYNGKPNSHRAQRLRQLAPPKTCRCLRKQCSVCIKLRKGIICVLMPVRVQPKRVQVLLNAI